MREKTIEQKLAASPWSDGIGGGGNGRGAQSRLIQTGAYLSDQPGKCPVAN